MQEFKTGKSAAGTRADVFIASKYPEFTRSALKGLFERDYVQVDGKRIKAGYKLRFGDKISVDTRSLTVEPEVIKLPIIYQDDDVIVINKPTGILTHSKGALNPEPTVASFIRDRIKDKLMSGNRAGIVHRLDRATSGVIICALNQQSLTWLQRQFSQRKVRKDYLAIVEGVPGADSAVIDVPIGRNPKRPQTFKAIVAGKPAQTEYKVAKKFKKGENDFSLIELKPVTGRTHQIRIHMAYIGHPVVGDAVYGRGGGEMLLHARNLELTLPNRERRKFSAPVPESFKEFSRNG